MQQGNKGAKGKHTGNPGSLKTGAANGRGARNSSSSSKAAGEGPEDIEPEQENGECTLLEQSFVRFYLLCWNATKAAQHAGYSMKTAYSTGSKLLKVPRVAALIKEGLREANEDFRGGRDAIMQFLLRIIYSDTTDLLKIETDATTGKLSVNFKDQSAFEAGAGMMINSITVGRNGLKIEIFSKQQAIDMYNRMLGYYEKDNAQKQAQGPTFYMPENGRAANPTEESSGEDKAPTY